jgi:hypothetical protein
VRAGSATGDRAGGHALAILSDTVEPQRTRKIFGAVSTPMPPVPP